MEAQDSWLKEWAARIIRAETLEIEGFDKARSEYARGLPSPGGGGKGFPFALPRRLARAITRVDDALAKQFLPDPKEAYASPVERDDALGEEGYRITPRAVRQYRSRLLLRANAECFANCRFCYRRGISGTERGFISGDELQRISRFLGETPEIREALISGGDPLAASDDRVLGMIRILRESRPGLSLRICTRAPTLMPERCTPALIRAFASQKPISIVAHINHPIELDGESTRALCSFVDSGIPVLSQSVLLAGVNDDENTLATLFSRLAALGVRPYYLFQGDLAPGTSHLRAPLSKGLSLYAALRRRLSGIEMPRYAVDIPGGKGKAWLPEDIASIERGEAKLATPDGRSGSYPFG
jgi:lysine 2,3-aminomutase